MYNCKFCNAEFESASKVARHYQLCKLNPANELVECEFCHRKFSPHRIGVHLKGCFKDNPKVFVHKTKKSGRGLNWAKGLTKETIKEIAKQSESLKEYYKTHAGTFSGKCHSEETKQLISQKLTEYNHANNNRNLHSKGGWFDGIYFMPTWELAYYIYQKDLDEPIQRCNQRFIYQYNGKSHYYTPDFVINDLIIEIKGRETEKDIVKYQAVKDAGLKLTVLYKKDILPAIEYVQQKYEIINLTELYQ